MHLCKLHVISVSAGKQRRLCIYKGQVLRKVRSFCLFVFNNKPHQISLGVFQKYRVNGAIQFIFRDLTILLISADGESDH